MRGSDPHPLVIYGTFFQEGVRSGSVVAESASGAAWPDLSPGTYLSRLHRSDGYRAEIEFSVKEGAGPKELARTIFDEDRWKWKADRFVDQLRPAEPGVQLAFWRGRTVEQSLFTHVGPTNAVRAANVDEAIIVLARGFVRAPVATMQVVTGDGASFFIRIPPREGSDRFRVRLNIFKASESSEASSGGEFPFPICEDQPATAYNIFLALGQYDAACAVGENVAKRVRATHKGRSGLIDTLVAAQWALRSHVDETSVTSCDRSLSIFGDQSDAATLRWLLAFDRRPKNRDSLGAELLNVFARLREEPPILSETLRLLTERLTPARIGLHAKGCWSGEHETGYKFVVQFARALVWPSVHTTYRGYGPDQPDRNASVEPAVKKN